MDAAIEHTKSDLQDKADSCRQVCREEAVSGSETPRRVRGLRVFAGAATVAALASIWWAYSAERQKAAVQSALALGSKITYADEMPFSHPNAAVRWLQEKLGHDYTSSVRGVDLGGKTLKESDLEFLQGFPNLRALWLHDTNVGDAEVKAILSNSRLEELSLQATRITDAALADLGRLSQLEFLYLENTAITDAGLAHLKNLAALKGLKLSKTRMTGEGVQRLRHALPAARIVFHESPVARN